MKAQPILHSSFFILHFPYLCGKQLKGGHYETILENDVKGIESYR